MPQAIPLPPFSDQAIAIIGAPNAPSNPPSVTDITKAMHYTRTLLNANAQKRVPGEDVVHSEQYKNKLLSTHDGNAEPLWFAGATERILTQTLAPIRADIQDIKDDIRHIQRVQGQVWKLAARNHNLSAGASDDANLEVVPFTDGRDPTKDPHNLPPMTCVKDVRHLSPQQRDKYYKGYYNTNQLPLVHERIEKILLAIGANA